MTRTELHTLIDGWTNLFGVGDTRALADWGNYPAPVYAGQDAFIIRNAREGERVLALLREQLVVAGVDHLCLDTVELTSCTETQCLAHAEWSHINGTGHSLGNTALTCVLSRRTGTTRWQLDATECEDPVVRDTLPRIASALSV